MCSKVLTHLHFLLLLVMGGVKGIRRFPLFCLVHGIFRIQMGGGGPPTLLGLLEYVLLLLFPLSTDASAL